MTVLKSVLLLLLISHFVPVSCQGSNPCQGRRNGKIPDPTSCSKYHECSNSRGKQKTCPDEEHYNAQAKNCVPISESDCVILTTRAHIKPTTVRPFRQPGSGSGSVSGSVSGSLSGSGSIYGSSSKPTCTPNETNLKLFNKYDLFGKSYYFSHKAEKDDIASEVMCQTVCGYLVEVNDKSEEETISKILSINNVDVALIGGTDKFRDKYWEYERGNKVVNYINWCLGQPDNNGGVREHCMSFKNTQKCMHDAPCYRNSFTSSYICESV